MERNVVMAQRGQAMILERKEWLIYSAPAYWRGELVGMVIGKRRNDDDYKFAVPKKHKRKKRRTWVGTASDEAHHAVIAASSATSTPSS